MSNVGNTRKLFLDIRFKISGTDSDFTLELPQDVQCTRTSSFFVASCSFANTFSTVTPYNAQFYWIERVNLAGMTVYEMNVYIIRREITPAWNLRRSCSAPSLLALTGKAPR